METGDPRMHPLTLRFPPAVEAAYYEQYYERSRRAVRIAIATLLILTATWGLAAAIFEPERIGSWVLASAVPASALGVLLLSFAPSFKVWMRPLLGVWIILLSVGITLNLILTRHVANVSVDLTGALVTGMIFAAGFLGLGFAYAVPTIVVMTSVTLALAFTFQILVDPLSVFPIVAGLLLTTLAAYFSERYIRMEFVASRLLEAERARSERLLLNILPEPVAERLKEGEETIADYYPEVTVLFADITGFTGLAARIGPHQVVETLNSIFSEFDRLTTEHGLEKIKTMGDSYMVVGGLPQPRADHAEAVAELALAMQAAFLDKIDPTGERLLLRVGINSGPVVAGVIGTTKFAYDLWGDAVNIASRMQTYGLPGSIQVTQSTREKLIDKFTFADGGIIDVKGKGEIHTYLLLGRVHDLIRLDTVSPMAIPVTEQARARARPARTPDASGIVVDGADLERSDSSAPTQATPASEPEPGARPPNGEPARD